MWGKKSPEPNRDLIDRMEKLEKSVRDIRLDWDDTYEKFARLNQRLAKRMRDQEKKAVVDDSTNGQSPETQPTGNPLAQRLLNPYGGRK